MNKFKSKKEDGTNGNDQTVQLHEKSSGRMPLHGAAAFLVDTFDLTNPVRGNRRLKRELDAISSGKRGQIREYYIRKIQVLLLVLAVGMILTAILFVTERNAERSLKELTLERPGYGEGSRIEELEAQVEDGPSRLLEVTVQDRKYTEEEKKELLQNAVQNLEQLVLAENPGPDEVRTSLFFPETLENGAVQADWTTMPYGVIDEEGTILEAEKDEGTLVQIQCILTCQGEETDFAFAVKVFPPDLSEEEQLWKEIDRQVSQADARDSTRQTLTLPRKAGGSRIIWRTPAEDTPTILLVLTVLAFLSIYVGMDGKIHRQAERRENQLALDYPDLMWKLAMLTGAGLTMKSAFRRIGEQYRRSRYEAQTERSKTEEQYRRSRYEAQTERLKTEEQYHRSRYEAQAERSKTEEQYHRSRYEAQDEKPNTKARMKQIIKKKAVYPEIRFAYEEVLTTIYEMESGVPEAEAYERFGRRCQLTCYIRLGSYLSQNLKKGSRGLEEFLVREAVSALEERKNNARKIGEKAGTRLLLPMILMLGVVIAVLMIPAFMVM